MKELPEGCTRRTFLKAAASATVVSALSVSTSGCGLLETDLDKAAKTMTDLLNHPEQARKLGQDFMQRNSRIGNLPMESLTADLLGLVEVDPGNLSNDDMNSLSGRLRRQIRQDFTGNNIVIINGFLHSKTEMMLCVLLHKRG